VSYKQTYRHSNTDSFGPYRLFALSWLGRLRIGVADLKLNVTTRVTVKG